MKKLLFILPLAIISNGIQAQGFSFELSGGYGFGVTKLYTEDAVDIETLMTYSYTETSEPIDLSTGFNGRFGANYQFGNGIFLTLGARYLQSSISPASYYYSYDDPTYHYVETESSEYDIRTLDMNFGIGMQQDLGSGLSLRMSAGPSINPCSHYLNTYEYSETYQSTGNPATTDSYKYEQEIKNDIGFGLYSSLGLNYRISDRFDLFMNSNLLMKAYSPKKSEIISYTVNGQDMLNTLTTSDKETIYQSEVNYSTSGSNPNNPYKSNKMWVPNSSIDLTLGVRFNLNNSGNTEDMIENEGFYIQGFGGYGLPWSGTYSFEFDYNGDMKGRTKQMSYGSGMYTGLRAGYNFMGGLSGELGWSYSSSEIKFSDHTPSGVTDYTHSSSISRIIAGFKLEGSQTVAPFIRTGLVIGMPSLSINEKSNNYDGTNNYDITEEYSGNLSFGAYSGLGVTWNITPKFSIQAEATAIMQNWSPAEGKYNKYVYFGMDQLANMDTQYKEWVYVDEWSENQNTTNDPDKPDERTQIFQPFSTLNFSIGVRYSPWGN